MPDKRILDMKLRVILKQRMVYKPIKPRRLIRRKPVAPRDAYPHPIRAVRPVIHKHAAVRADAGRRIRDDRTVPAVRVRQKDRLVKTSPSAVRRVRDSDAYPYRRIALIDRRGLHIAAQRVPVRRLAAERGSDIEQRRDAARTHDRRIMRHPPVPELLAARAEHNLAEPIWSLRSVRDRVNDLARHNISGKERTRLRPSRRVHMPQPVRALHSGAAPDPVSIHAEAVFLACRKHCRRYVKALHNILPKKTTGRGKKAASRCDSINYLIIVTLYPTEYFPPFSRVMA